MSAKTLCLQHGEKVLFGASAFLLVGYVTFGFALAGPDPFVAEMSAEIAAAQAKMAETTPPAGFQPVAQFDVAGAWGRVAAPFVSTNHWPPYRKGCVTASLLDSGGKPAVPVLLPPALDPPAVEVGKVTLSWNRPKGCDAPLSGWRVMRRPASDAAWEEVASCRLEETSFADVTVAADASYEYCVRAVPDSSAVKIDDQGRDSEVRPVQTPSDVRLRLVCASGDLAQIEVAKHMGGAWKTHTFPVRVGEPIGKDLRASIGGEVQPFGTGFVLVSVGEATRTHRVKRTGQHLVNDPVEASRQILVPIEEWIEVVDRGQRAIYRDGRGNVQELWQ